MAEKRDLKAISAEDMPEDTRGALLKPRRTQGNSKAKRLGLVSHKRYVQPPINALNHAIGLRMIDGACDMVDSDRLAKGGPRQRVELCALI